MPWRNHEHKAHCDHSRHPSAKRRRIDCGWLCGARGDRAGGQRPRGCGGFVRDPADSLSRLNQPHLPSACRRFISIRGRPTSSIVNIGEHVYTILKMGSRYCHRLNLRAGNLSSFPSLWFLQLYSCSVVAVLVISRNECCQYPSGLSASAASCAAGLRTHRSDAVTAVASVAIGAGTM